MRPFSFSRFVATAICLVAFFTEANFAQDKKTEESKPEVSADEGGMAGPEINENYFRYADSKIRELSRKVMPAVVALIPGGPQRRMGTGSGVIVSEDGLILTAAHVAVEMNEQVTVIFPDGNRADAKVLGMDYSRDAAMLKIVDSKEKFPFVELGDSDVLKRNDFCIAIGHPGGFQADRSPPIRLGRLIRNVDDEELFLVTDSALNGGDSGGPLFDIDGELIGIHSNIGFSLSQNRHVPIEVFTGEWDRLKEGERFGGSHLGGFLDNPDRPVMGAVLDETEEKSGARVVQLLRRSPAKKAGLKVGDVIVKAGKKEITSVQSLLDLVGRKKPGDYINLTVKSPDEDAERGVKVRLGAAKNFDLSPMPQVEKENPRLEKKPDGDEEMVPDPDESLTDKGKKKKGSEEDVSSPKSRKELAEFQGKFEKDIREMMENGDLELTPEQIEDYGGPMELGKMMREFEKGLSEEDRDKLFKMLIAETMPEPLDPKEIDPEVEFPINEKFFRQVLDAFHPSVEQAEKATHYVFRGTEWKALCTVIHEDGYALTKASEIDTKNNQKLTVLIAKGKLVPAEVVKVFDEHDLALLRLSGVKKKMPFLTFASASRSTHPLGAIIAAAGTGPDPVAIGVISVLSRTLASDRKGFLGVGPGPHPKGVRVAMVGRGTAAEKADVRAGDVITKINDTVCDTPEKLLRVLQNFAPGTEIKLHYLRGEKSAVKKIKLGDRMKADAGRREPNGRMNEFGTNVSKRSTGFANVFQTDMPISPEQCGGPVVDLDGRIIGLNISRAGRVKTYTIPGSVIEKLVDGEISKLIQSASKPAPAKAGAEAGTDA